MTASCFASGMLKNTISLSITRGIGKFVEEPSILGNGPNTYGESNSLVCPSFRADIVCSTLGIVDGVSLQLSLRTWYISY
jgi:hypothetical protein